MPDLSIIIVTYNSEKYIAKCIDSINCNLKDVSFETIVVDNNSTDATVAILTEKPNVILLRNNKNVGFAAANNRGIKSARGSFVLILNPDIIITSSTVLKDMISYYIQNPSTGIMSARLFYEDGSVQESARKFPAISFFLIRGFKLEQVFKKSKFYQLNTFDCELPKKPIKVDWVIGAFMLMKKTYLEEVGMFDEKYFMYYEDADLCLKFKRKGYKIVYYPLATAIHAYHRESAKSFFSLLKLIHFKSFIRFFLRLKKSRLVNC